MTLLRIPPQSVTALANLCTADHGLVEGIAAILNEAPFYLDGAELVDFVASRIGYERLSVAELIELLLSLTAVRLRLDLDPPRLIEAVIEAVEEGDDSKLQFIAEHSEVVASRLNSLLGKESLIYPTKAADIILAHEYTFCHARIITDVRPIFGTDVASRPRVAAIIHTLQLTCHHGDDVKDFYVALDADDLALLKEVLNRAELKAGSLRTVLSDGGITSVEG